MDAYAFEARFTGVVPVGLTARGLRLDIGFAGRVTEGLLRGHLIEGVDYFLIRPDGVGVIDARERISDGARVVAAVRAEGYVVPPVPMPELSVLAEPGYSWPDVDFPLHGVHFWETTDGAYAFTGSANLVGGALRVSARSLAAP